jgi:hypothetical protein
VTLCSLFCAVVLSNLEKCVLFLRSVSLYKYNDAAFAFLLCVLVVSWSSVQGACLYRSCLALECWHSIFV